VLVDAQDVVAGRVRDERVVVPGNDGVRVTVEALTVRVVVGLVLRDVGEQHTVVDERQLARVVQTARDHDRPRAVVAVMVVPRAVPVVMFLRRREVRAVVARE
jgi:hypothetical protein